MCDPGFQILLMEGVKSEDRSGAGALNYLVISIAQAIAAAVAGDAFARFGYAPVLTAIAVTAAAAALVFGTLFANGQT